MAEKDYMVEGKAYRWANRRIVELEAQLAAAREEAAKWEAKHTLEYAARGEAEAALERAADDADLASLSSWREAETARASRAEAAIQRVREWAEDAATKQYPLGYQAKHVLSLIEHGPDDGRDDG